LVGERRVIDGVVGNFLQVDIFLLDLLQVIDRVDPQLAQLLLRRLVDIDLVKVDIASCGGCFRGRADLLVGNRPKLNRDLGGSLLAWLRGDERHVVAVVRGKDIQVEGHFLHGVAEWSVDRLDGESFARLVQFHH